MTDVTALGELLIDFTACGKSSGGISMFEQNPGGAPANVLCALSNMNMKTAFIGKVGDDMHGELLMKTLQDKGINTDGVIKDADVFTTLAFVELSETGERKFSFARKPGADTCLTELELNMDILKSSRIFHFGSLSLTDEPARSATIAAVKAAKEAGSIISYDPNYRPPLWKDEDSAVTQMRSVLSYVDIMKLSEEETFLVTGKAAPEDAAEELLRLGMSCVVITLGENGALVSTKTGMKKVAGFQCEAVDCTGAGDAFWGGFLYKLLHNGKRPDQISLDEAVEFAVFANAVAALCVQKRGAIPAMPLLNDVNMFLQNHQN